MILNLKRTDTIIPSKDKSEEVERGAEEHLGPYQSIMSEPLSKIVNNFYPLAIFPESPIRCSTEFKYTSEILLLIHKPQKDMN